MNQPSSETPIFTQPSRLSKYKVAAVKKSNIKWWLLFGVIVVLVLCLIFIPGAPIYNLIWPDSIVVVVPPNDSSLPPVPIVIPSMRNDGNYNAVVSGYTSDAGFANEDMRNTAIVIVGNFMAEQQIGGVNPQAFSNAKLYSILAAASVDDAKRVILA